MAKKKLPIDNLLIKQSHNKSPTEQVECSFNPASNTGTVTTKSLNIKTLDDALQSSNVDLSIWEVERYVVNSWEVTMGVGKSGTSHPETFTNYQVKVWLKKKVKESIDIAIDKVLSRHIKPKFPVINYNLKNNKYMLEISLFDHHFGKLSWGKETNGVDYDLKIAKYIYESSIQDTLCKIKHYKISEILFPIGQDFFHVNDTTSQTPAGKNSLDTDARLIKVFESGIEACIRAIYKCLVVAPIHIIWVPGNHDPETSYYLCKVIQHHFFNNKNVKVDVSPTYRKYKKYGVNLLGFTHGNEEPHRDLPTIMADEEKKAWAETSSHEWHVGHLHKRKQTRYLAGDTYGSVVVRTLPSLSGVDHWHYKKGYVNGIRASESYLWSKTEGYVGHFSSNFKPPKK